mgnify:FL=1
MNINKESRFPAPVFDGRRLRSTASRSPLRGHIALVLCLIMALSVAGCGQRGPLYLPEEEPAVQETEAEPVTEEDSEEDTEENDEENP